MIPDPAAALDPLGTWAEAQAALREAYLDALLRRCSGNTTAAARVAGMPRTALLNLMSNHRGRAGRRRFRGSDYRPAATPPPLAATPLHRLAPHLLGGIPRR